MTEANGAGQVHVERAGREQGAIREVPLERHVGLIGHKIAADVTAAGFKGILTNALYDTWWHGGFRTAPYFHNSIGIVELNGRRAEVTIFRSEVGEDADSLQPLHTRVLADGPRASAPARPAPRT